MTKRIEQFFDFIVAGGGLAGVCAAIAAARHGLKTCLVHERPVLGGVASSEMRVTVHGAGCHHAYGRETGIIAELLADERARNHEEINENGWTNSVFDQVLYDACVREPNLTLHLNTPVLRVEMDGAGQVEIPPHTRKGYYEREACAPSRQISALIARTLSAEVELRLSAPLFADCTGDAIVADRAGCAWRMGSESRAEHGELHAPELASTETMGNSIHIRAKDIGREAPFTPPPWAVRHEDPDFFYKQGRGLYDMRGGFWWIEIGVPWHTIHDNETIRHELTRHALGVWDWMKNRDPKTKDRCRNFALEFIGQVPGKRESRRVVGHHWLTETQLQAREAFPDAICHGGWFVDLHTPGGLLAPTSEPASAEGYKSDSEYAAKSYVGPYGIPLRSLIARDVDNLFLAGRCISTTRAALGTVRVMGTTAMMGQAVGTAAAEAKRRGLDLPQLATDAANGGPAITSVQQTLLRDGAFIPGVINVDPADRARSARVSASSSASLHGVGPEDQGPCTALRGMPRGSADLASGAGQMIWCSGRIDRLTLCLDNRTGAALELPLNLVRATSVWDYRKGGTGLVASANITVPPGASRWVAWDVGLQDLGSGWLRLETGAVPGLAWCFTRSVLPGHVAFSNLSPSRWRGMHAGLAFRVEPPQDAFGPQQVLSGVTRPGSASNTWRSDPGQGLPQWLGLAWDMPQDIGRVELTFPGQLLGEVHREGPFYIEPQVARDYAIEIDGVEALRITGNTAWRRCHDLPHRVSLRQLRVVVLATNGDAAASMVEIRCY